ncbi:hypothetical protein CCP2SC5_390006 [Azospirillaceae bacterium]
MAPELGSCVLRREKMVEKNRNLERKKAVFGVVLFFVALYLMFGTFIGR